MTIDEASMHEYKNLNGLSHTHLLTIKRKLEKSGSRKQLDVSHANHSERSENGLVATRILSAVKTFRWNFVRSSCSSTPIPYTGLDHRVSEQAWSKTSLRLDRLQRQSGQVHVSIFWDNSPIV